MRISNKKLFIDLKYFSLGCNILALNYEEMADEYWKKYIFSDHGLPACKSYFFLEVSKPSTLTKMHDLNP